jgi:nicotinate-nucleotide adenylyltransferase
MPSKTLPLKTIPPKTIGVLAGAFNPLTRAHVALLEAGRSMVDEVICAVPAAYPHKRLEGATPEERIAMLERAAEASAVSYRVLTTQGGLFIDIARELRRAHPHASIEFLCGRDAAERVLGWDYGPGHSVERMLDEFGLLVAARQGEYIAPAHLSRRIRTLPMVRGYDDHSSTEVRRRIAAGEPWEHLVPPAIADLVRGIYAPAGITPSKPPRRAGLARHPPAAAPPAPPQKTRSGTESPRDTGR